MKSKIVRIKEAKEYSENPFLNELNIPIIPKSNMYVKKDEAVINLADGELKNDVLLVGKQVYSFIEEVLTDKKEIIMAYGEQLRQEGRQEGLQQGMQQEKLGIARTMLSKGYSSDAVEELTGLSSERLHGLQ